MLTIFAIIIYIKSPDKKSLALGEAQGRGGGEIKESLKPLTALKIP